LLEIVADLFGHCSHSGLFCGPCLAEGRAGLTLITFPPDLHVYRKRARQEDMQTFPEEYGISKLHNVNYVFPYNPHTIYPSDQEMLKKMRNDEVPSYSRSLQALEAAADKAAEEVNWLSNVDYQELINDDWRYSPPENEEGWLSTEALHKAGGFNREDRSHRDINFEIHSG
jgi:hypothetical protein